MYSYPINFSNFIAILYLKKTNFLGVEKTISIVVTPTFKVVKIDSTHNSNIPIKKGEILNIEKFSKWVVENNYELYFLTKNSTSSNSGFIFSISSFFISHHLIFNSLLIIP